jgi:Ca-activated chloride channel homolog
MFELAFPWVFLVLPLPFLLWFLLPRTMLQLPTALRVPFFDAICSIIDKKKPILREKTQMRLFLLIWSLLVFAAAGPRWVGEPQPLAREGRNIMLALDLSGSMELPDMLVNGQPASRLDVVKQAAEQFVKARTEDPVGLVLFGTRAYLQTPLTFDHHNVLMRLDDATVGLAGQTTSIGDAIGLAVKRLQDVPAKSRMIILLTDGANNSGILSPLKAAELARLDNIKIYTIGLGAEDEQNSFGENFLAKNTTADLDEEALKEIAKITGGRYFRATDTQSLHSIYQTINQLEPVRQEQATVRPQQDLYPWPLALALLLLFYWLSRKAVGLQAIFLPREVNKR